MKKLILIIVVLCCCNMIYSQTITYQKRKFDNSIFYSVTNKGMILVDDDKEGVGGYIIPTIKNDNGVYSLTSISGGIVGLSCLDAMLIDIIFENEEKMTLKNEYNKFNCDGNFSSIKLSKKNIELLKFNNISKIRFLIYRDSKISTTTKMEEKNKTFLKEVLENIDKVNNGLEVKETVE